MKSVILAAGKGTRMKELTREIPKPMLPVAGRPALAHILAGLQAAGVDEHVIITGYLAEAIESGLGDGSRFGWRVHYVRQEVQDGTGKAPELARSWLGEDPFFLTYGDILVSPHNYAALRRTLEGGAAAVLGVWEGEDVSKGAAVMLDEQSRVLDIIEKPPPGTVSSRWYNAGVYIFTPLLFEYTRRLGKSPRGEYELTAAIRDMVAAGEPVMACRLTGFWIDLRDAEALARAQGFAAEPPHSPSA